MGFLEIIILTAIIGFVIYVFYANFFKKKNQKGCSGCQGCSNKAGCSSYTDDKKD